MLLDLITFVIKSDNIILIPMVNSTYNISKKSLTIKSLTIKSFDYDDYYDIDEIFKINLKHIANNINPTVKIIENNETQTLKDFLGKNNYIVDQIIFEECYFGIAELCENSLSIKSIIFANCYFLNSLICNEMILHFELKIYNKPDPQSTYPRADFKFKNVEFHKLVRFNIHAYSFVIELESIRSYDMIDLMPSQTLEGLNIESSIISNICLEKVNPQYFNIKKSEVSNLNISNSIFTEPIHLQNFYKLDIKFYKCQFQHEVKFINYLNKLSTKFDSCNFNDNKNNLTIKSLDDQIKRTLKREFLKSLQIKKNEGIISSDLSEEDLIRIIKNSLPNEHLDSEKIIMQCFNFFIENKPTFEYLNSSLFINSNIIDKTSTKIDISNSILSGGMKIIGCTNIDFLKSRSNEYRRISIIRSNVTNKVSFINDYFSNGIIINNTTFEQSITFFNILLEEKGHLNFCKNNIKKGINIAESNFKNNLNFWGIKYDTYIPNNEVEKKEIQESLRIIKNAFRQNNDSINALRFEKHEIDVFQTTKLEWHERIQLQLNDLSNKQRTDWIQGIIFTLTISFLTYWIALLFILIEFRFPKCSYHISHLGINNIIEFLNVLNITKWDIKLWGFENYRYAYIILFLGRIFISYGYYQTVQAFRKYSKV